MDQEENRPNGWEISQTFDTIDYSKVRKGIIHLDIWQHSFYHLFLPIETKKEVNTEYILQVLAGKDKNIVLSVSDFSTREMTHFLLTDTTTIKKNKYNIPEPVDGIEVPSKKIEVVTSHMLTLNKYKKSEFENIRSVGSSSKYQTYLSKWEPDHHVTKMFNKSLRMFVPVLGLKTNILT